MLEDLEHALSCAVDIITCVLELPSGDVRCKDNTEVREKGFDVEVT